MKAPKHVYKLFALTIGMFFFGFLLVPIYDIICDVTGLNGKTNEVAYAQPDMLVDYSREVEVKFITSNNSQMEWEFRPTVSSITLNVGEVKQVNFYARNPTGENMIAQAVPSVAPSNAASSFIKVECFCFDRQPLAAHEETEMSVMFYLDPDLDSDVTQVVLSYTLFDVTPSDT